MRSTSSSALPNPPLHTARALHTPAPPLTVQFHILQNLPPSILGGLHTIHTINPPSNHTPSKSQWRRWSSSGSIPEITITVTEPGSEDSTAQSAPEGEPPTPTVTLTPPSDGAPALILTPNCAARILKFSSTKSSPHHLRVSVDPGGCSGFSYVFELEPEDLYLEGEDVRVPSPDNPDAFVVTDVDSLELLQGR